MVAAPMQAKNKRWILISYDSATSEAALQPALPCQEFFSTVLPRRRRRRAIAAAAQ
jgi:hypothetical protein